MPIMDLKRKLLLENEERGSSSGSSTATRRSNKKQITTGNVIVIDNSDVIQAIREFGSLQRKAELVTQRSNYLMNEDQ
jgi:hypothetical protein